MKTVAGIDLGTQSMKVVIYDYENHEIIEKASCPMDLISENDGTREQKTEWFDNGPEEFPVRVQQAVPEWRNQDEPRGKARRERQAARYS